MEKKSKALQRALRLLGAAVWAGIILFAVLHRQDYTLERILNYTPKSPPLAFLVLMALFALKSLTVVFYSGLLYAAGGVLFPLPVAILANICGTLVMSAIPYLFARSVGAAQADELRGKYPKLQGLERIRSRNRFAFVVMLRCVNIVNFDVGSMYCGAVRIAFLPFLAASVTGKLVDLVLWTVMGASLSDPSPALLLLALGVDLLIARGVFLWTKRQNAKEDKKED